MPSSVAAALAQLDILFAPDFYPILPSPPRTFLPMQTDAEVAASLLFQGYWLCHLALSWPDHQLNFVWGNITYSWWRKLFEDGLRQRRNGFRFAFQTLTPGMLLHLRSTFLNDRSQGDERQRRLALLALMEAVLDHQTNMMLDEYGNELPLPIDELLAITEKKRPLRNQGNANITTRLLIESDTYYLKRDRKPEDLIASAQDYRHECAITAALQTFPWQLGPKEAYHFVGDDGLHYALIHEVSGKIIEEPWAAAHRVSLLSAQVATLIEYALVILDRHHKNILVDSRQHMLHEIDFGSALDPEDGTHLMRSREPHLPPEKSYYSHARAIWEHHPFGSEPQGMRS